MISVMVNIVPWMLSVKTTNVYVDLDIVEMATLDVTVSFFYVLYVCDISLWRIGLSYKFLFNLSNTGYQILCQLEDLLCYWLLRHNKWWYWVFECFNWRFWVRVTVMVFSATFNNISVIVAVSFVGGENHRPAVCHWPTLSHNVVSSRPHLSRIQAHNLSDDRHRLHR